jgi:asparagine synthetase B (glutamine-hydrolysing)
MWIRNFGRDDRCISANGKECRYPYLDFDLLKLLSNFPMELFFNKDNPKGMQQKRVLRIIASQFGFT